MRLTPVVLTSLLLAACEGRAPAPSIGEPAKVDPKVIIREPQWLRKPTREEVAALRPAAAKDFKLSAVANMWCTAKADGTLDACRLDWQDPPGMGFGEAAMKTVPLWKMAPADKHGLVEGRPVEAQVTWPKPTDLSDLTPQSAVQLASGAHPALVTYPRWARRPTAAEIAALPQPLSRPNFDVRVMMRCRITGEGSLENCRIESETPSGSGWSATALAAAPLFRMALDKDADAVGADVRIPFGFRSEG